MIRKPIIGIVIVSYGHEKYLTNLVKLLRDQMRAGDQIVVVDNHPSGNSHSIMSGHKAVDFAIKADNNGFAAGCNEGASKIINLVDILFFVNPDTSPEKNVIDVIRNADYEKYSAVMPLLLLPNGDVNSAGNTIHISGLSWSSGYGIPTEKYNKDQDVSALSGACLAVSKKWWNKLGGIPESYFLYYEDIDFCTQIILRGGRLCLLPKAKIEHDYDFSKGSHKWVYLERNRPLYILRTWPTSVIVVLFIQLFLVEIGLWVVAILQKRFKMKIKSFFMTLKALPIVIKNRHIIQKKRKISGYEFLLTLSYKLDTPMLGKIGENKLINTIFMIYYKISLQILKLFR